MADKLIIEGVLAVCEEGKRPASFESLEGNNEHAICNYSVAETKTSNAAGREFLAALRAIIDECSRLKSPQVAAAITAFEICAMLDGSGEACGPLYQVLTEDGRPVKFFHHDL